MNGALGIMEIGVQVELLLTCGDIKVQRLDAVHTTQTCMGIKCTRAALVLEPQLGHCLGNIVGDLYATEGDNALGSDQEGMVLGRDLNILNIGEEGVTKALVVLELYLRQVGHRGITITAMGHDHQLIGAWFELETGPAIVGIASFLVDLFHTLAVNTIHGIVDMGRSG